MDFQSGSFNEAIVTTNANGGTDYSNLFFGDYGNNLTDGRTVNISIKNSSETVVSNQTSVVSVPRYVISKYNGSVQISVKDETDSTNPIISVNLFHSNNTTPFNLGYSQSQAGFTDYMNEISLGDTMLIKVTRQSGIEEDHSIVVIIR